MQVNDQSYLEQFRKLTATKKQILARINDFGSVCESLKSWSKTARELATLPRNHPEWSEENLKRMVELKTLLVRYHEESESLAVIWRALTEDQRCGLADLQSFQVD